MAKYRVILMRTEYKRAELVVDAGQEEDAEETARESVCSDDYDIVDADEEVESVTLITDEPATPEEGDYVTTDYKHFYQYGKIAVSVSDRPLDEFSGNWAKMVKAHMDNNQYWPDVWYQGERGEYNLLSLETGTFVQQ